jgi:metal-responsive CopG/Arc/MetJ family transcriptional regulator
MSTSKIAITLNSQVLSEVDALVKRRIFPSRSRAIQEAVKEKLERLNHSRLAQECSKLDPDYEKALAEEGLGEDLSEWPEY